MEVVLTFVCICLAVAIAAASFVYGKQIGYTERNAELAERQSKDKDEQVKQLEQLIFEMEHQLEVEQKEKTRQQPSRNGWENIDIRG